MSRKSGPDSQILRRTKHISTSKLRWRSPGCNSAGSCNCSRCRVRVNSHVEKIKEHHSMEQSDGHEREKRRLMHYDLSA